MGELTNALQGKLNSRKGQVKDSGGGQLDLFSSLSDREAAAPKIIMSAKPDAAPAAGRPEPELVLPPAGPPPDVAADVRAVLSESGPARAVEAPHAADEARAPLRTGIYQRPRRVAAPPPPPPPAKRPPAGPRPAPLRKIRAWFAGVELDRRLVALVVVLAVLVGAVAYWTARPGDEPAPGTRLDLAEVQPVAASPAPAKAPDAPAAAPAPAAPTPAPAAAVPAAGWTIAGAETVLNGGAVLVRFSQPVFVSSDRISVEGMAALKAVAAKLVTLNAGTRVVVTGYTDNEPLTKPTPQFTSNADIAAARAKAAVEHLAQFARAGKGLAFEAQTGDPAQAPYPNDSPQNRRLNRTVTVQVIPAP